MKRALSFLRAIDVWLYRFVKVLVACIIASQLIIVSLGVVSRYALNFPIIWTDEIAGYLLVMVTFFGCHVAVCENRLAAVTILLEKLTGISKKAVNFLANLSIIFLLAMVAYYGYYLCQQPAITKSVTSVLQWPLVIFYYMLPLSSAFMLYHMLIQCAMDLLGIECTPLGQQTEGTVD